MRNKITLTNPLNRGNGLLQSEIDVCDIKIRPGGIIVRTVQGNSVVFKKTPAIDTFITALENKVKRRLEGVDLEESLEISPEIPPA